MNTIKNYLHENRVLLACVVLVVFALVLAFGLYQAYTYSYPMLTGQYSSARSSAVADDPVVTYDMALTMYEREDYQGAEQLAMYAAQGLVGSDGHMSESRRELAAKIYFLRGNALVKLKQTDAAVEAYQEALRNDPTHLEAKYNLELLQKPPLGGGGQGSGQGNGNGQGQPQDGDPQNGQQPQDGQPQDGDPNQPRNGAGKGINKKI